VNTQENKWKLAQAWELDWHGNCINSFHEEEKQLVYAEKMGLIRTPLPKTPYNFDLEGKSILDIGGGAYSLLLKCVNYAVCDEVTVPVKNAEWCKVIDPLMAKYPRWVRDRYSTAHIHISDEVGESIIGKMIFDEVWIYNVLEHTKEPKKVIENALELGNIVRIFEWVGTTTNIGHPHSLNKKQLDKWLGGEGKVENISHNGAVGTAYYGIFVGDKFNGI